jgi:hypothetical protein
LDTFRLNKNTIEDKRSIIYHNLKLSFKAEDDDSWVYLLDFDDTYAYFEVYGYEQSVYRTFRVAYTFSGTQATFDAEPEEVVKLSEYKLLESDESEGEESTERSMLKALTDFFKGEGAAKLGAPVIKQFEDELMIAIEPLYIAAGDVDGQGDTITLSETRSLVKSFNEAIESGNLQTSLFHKHKTSAFTVIKGWVNECECYIGETLVPEGQPLAQIQFTNEAAWDLRKSGVLMGLSIGARATVDEIA